MMIGVALSMAGCDDDDEHDDGDEHDGHDGHKTLKHNLNIALASF